VRRSKLVRRREALPPTQSRSGNRYTVRKRRMCSRLSYRNARLVTGSAWPLQDDRRKRNLNGTGETIRLGTGALAGRGVRFGNGIAIKKLRAAVGSVRSTARRGAR
jgi:hypothetical protein